MVDLSNRLATEWRIEGTRTHRSQFSVASVAAETTLFAHRETAAALDGVTESELPIRSLFATAIRFRPTLPPVGVAPGAALSIAAPRAKRLFLETVEDRGLVVGKQHDSGRFERADGTAGRRYVLSTACPIDADTREAPEDEATADGGTSGTEGGRADGAGVIDAETHVAIWPTATSYAMAGGTLPLEAPAGLADAIAVDPDRDRETIREFTETIDPGSKER